MNLKKGTQVGELEEVSLISQENSVWDTLPYAAAVRMVNEDNAKEDKSDQRRKKLQRQLVIGDGCPEDERQRVIDCLMSVEQVFALSDDELGETKLVKHCIDTGEAKPVRTSPRRFPYSLRSELEEELRKLLQTKCIEPANSPYASPLVPVRKKDGSIRVCIDYRVLNKDTVPDSYPIPRIDDLVDAIGRQKGKVFSSLDLMKGYHQVRMADTSKWKTAFTCHMGLFQYRRMPFGLTNAPATFQRLMNQLFQGSEWDFVFIYLDDILIVSSSVEEHRLHLKKILQRLDEAGLCLKPSKCHFVKRQIDYLGYTVSQPKTPWV